MSEETVSKDVPYVAFRKKVYDVIHRGGRWKRVRENLEPWFYMGDRELKKPFPDDRSKSGKPAADGEWTFQLLHILACLHENERRHGMWLASKDPESGEGPVEEYGPMEGMGSIGRECSMRPENVSRVLNRLFRHGYVRKIREWRNVRWEITDLGMTALWTGLRKRGCARTKSRKYWVRTWDFQLSYSALELVRELRLANDEYVSGGTNPQYSFKEHIRRTRGGEVLVRRRSLFIHHRAVTRTGIKNWCWRPQLVWQMLKKVPLDYARKVIHMTELKQSRGHVRHFFAYTWSILGPAVRWVRNVGRWVRTTFTENDRYTKRLTHLVETAQGRGGESWHGLLSVMKGKGRHEGMRAGLTYLYHYKV